MAIKQTLLATGQLPTVASREGGVVNVVRDTFTISENLAQGDIIEAAILPANAVVTDMVLVADETGTATYDVGFMSGDPGSTDPARTSGTEFFSGVADATTHRLSLASAFRLQQSDKDRSIGVKIGTAGITGSGQLVTLQVSYVF